MSLRGTGAGVLLVWLAEVLEQALPQWLPRGAAVLPVICAVVLWNRSASGLCLGGVLLLLDWIARPTSFPAAPLLLPLFAALLHTAGPDESGLQRRRFRIPAPLLLPLLAGVLLTAQSLSLDSWNVWRDPLTAARSALQHGRPALLVLLPVSGVLALLLQLSEELGLRRVAASG
jgi:uncharacterized membrane protein YphA (DoxX/SURF4 family)